MWGGVGLARHQWLLIVAIAAGLVGMHHLVHADTAHVMPMTMTSAPPTEHIHPAPTGVTPVAMTSPSAAQADCCDPMTMMGHLCLAVLTGLIALIAAMIFASASRQSLESGRLLAAVGAVAARAPPTGCPRLTQLCVLRC